MTQTRSITQPQVLVAIDVAKLRHQVLVQLPSGMRKHLKINNTKADFERLAAFLHSCGSPCRIASEATGGYHRPVCREARMSRRRALTTRCVGSLFYMPGTP